MSTDTQHLVYHRSRVSELEHELALARASSDYWRTKYIAARNVGAFGAYSNVIMSNANSLYWFERAARSPLDECDE